jgi:hypothetical protein
MNISLNFDTMVVGEIVQLISGSQHGFAIWQYEIRNFVGIVLSQKKKSWHKKRIWWKFPKWELTDKRSTAVNFVLQRSVIHALKFYNSKEPKRIWHVSVIPTNRMVPSMHRSFHFTYPLNIVLILLSCSAIWLTCSCVTGIDVNSTSHWCSLSWKGCIDAISHRFDS